MRPAKKEIRNKPSRGPEALFLQAMKAAPLDQKQQTRACLVFAGNVEKHSIYGYSAADISVSTIVSLKRHFEATQHRRAVVEVLCSLLWTDCFDSILKYGGFDALVSILEKDIH